MTAATHILIVDDDPATLKILRRALADLGEVHGATSGAQALQIVADAPIDLVLLDIVMPAMDGFATCRALLQAHPDLAVLFVTVANDTADEIEALAVGGHDFISKPINPPVVRARVTLHLKLRAQYAEIKRIEALARRQLAEIQAYYDTAPVGLFVLDTELRYRRINERLAAMNGQPVAAHLGRTVRELLPDLADSIEPLFRRVIATGEPLLNLEIAEPSATRPGGQRVWQADYYPLRDTAGNIIGINGFAKDITWRQQIEQNLRDSERRYRELNAMLEQRVAERTAEVLAANALLQEREASLQFILAGSRLGTWDWDIASGTVRRNDFWAAMLGYTREEVDDATADGWLALIHPDDRARAWQSIDDHLAGRTPLHASEYRMRTRDGGYRWVLDRAQIVSRDGEGRPRRMSGTHEDITSRKQTQQALEESHQRLLTVLNAMDAQIYLADMATHEILFLNRSLLQTYGPREGQPCYRALQGLDAPCPFCTNDRLVNAAGRPAGVYAWEFQNQLNQRWYDLRDCAVRWTDGRLARMEIATDITERKQIELRLRQSEERFRLVAAHVLDNIWTMGTDHRLRYTSPSILFLIGYDVEECLSMTLEQLLMPDSLKVAATYFAGLDERRAAGLSVADYPFRGELELRTKAGTGIWTEIIATPLVDSEGRMTELAGVTRDIRERKRYEAALQQAREAAETANQALQAANTELQRLATTDRLTGIWNRHYFEEAVSAELGRVARYGEYPLSLLLFDLDHFKAINDTHGHLVGDQVLSALTHRVRQHLRAADVLARWGGEEFVVLLPHTGGAAAVRLAEQLRRLVAGEPFPVVGRVTSSFGVAEFRPDETLDRWLQRVDAALYAAKTAGRNRVSLHP